MSSKKKSNLAVVHINYVQTFLGVIKRLLIHTLIHKNSFWLVIDEKLTMGIFYYLTLVHFWHTNYVVIHNHSLSFSLVIYQCVKRWLKKNTPGKGGSFFECICLIKNV